MDYNWLEDHEEPNQYFCRVQRYGRVSRAALLIDDEQWHLFLDLGSTVRTADTCRVDADNGQHMASAILRLWGYAPAEIGG